MACLAAKPIVHGIEKDLEGTAPVIHVDLLSAFGREVAGRYGIRSIPATVVLDAEREVIYRTSGMPDRDEVVATLLSD